MSTFLVSGSVLKIIRSIWKFSWGVNFKFQLYVWMIWTLISQNFNAYMFKNANENSDIMKATYLGLNWINPSQEYDIWF